jgi:hypothetical protein
MPQLNQTPVNCIFGNGIPTLSAPNGAEYVDDTSGFFYKFYGGIWNLIGGGGGGASNVYSYAPSGVVFGYGTAFIPALAYGPYTFVYAGKGAADPAQSYGGALRLLGGDAGNAPYAYGGDSYIYGGNAFYGTYSYGGDLTLAGGGSNGSALSQGGDVIIIPGYAVGAGSNYQGNLIFRNIPAVNPGGSGIVWNSAGTLKIT